MIDMGEGAQAPARRLPVPGYALMGDGFEEWRLNMGGPALLVAMPNADAPEVWIERFDYSIVPALFYETLMSISRGLCLHGRHQWRGDLVFAFGGVWLYCDVCHRTKKVPEPD